MIFPVFPVGYVNLSVIAERCHECSRGLQPTDYAGQGMRRVATLDANLAGGSARLFNRRSATRPHELASRGLEVPGYPQPVALRPWIFLVTIFHSTDVSKKGTP
jgi:hypothetical protein